MPQNPTTSALTVECRTCGAQPGEPCMPTGTLTSVDEWWQAYRVASPHPSREMTADDRA